ncbi:methanethiol S-methyltransferase [Flavobacterium sp. 140616W15]|uniref:methanethiol S-methyltransferase n=1 Tax=Flavobacterium sp. 140616W15 TaxID=2478552 RepID=UPI000F0D1378|nr:methanethiol S-methyltransferase [Flavobacterium sp. 140616W15]AYN03354.1 isoprenylcysteine carboxylmethyltransferase family protein [Flavobacterium sp. 140616W15]
MIKSITFLYGVFAYLLFLIAFLYAIGFVGNFIVPKSIDTGTETTFVQALLVNVLLLSLFALQHSIMARPAFKKWWTSIISPVIERSTYVLLSSSALLLMYWQWQPMRFIIWEIENKTATMIINGIYFLGWIIVLLSTFIINHFELFGLKQIIQNMKNKATQPECTTFKISYLYKIVRHPIMLGFLIAFWATPLMTLGHLVFTLTTTAYIFIAVKFLEEKDLQKFYGEEYKNYQKKVPMLLPFIQKGN